MSRLHKLSTGLLCTALLASMTLVNAVAEEPINRPTVPVAARVDCRSHPRGLLVGRSTTAYEGGADAVHLGCVQQVFPGPRDLGPPGAAGSVMVAT